MTANEMIQMCKKNKNIGLWYRDGFKMEEGINNAGCCLGMGGNEEWPRFVSSIDSDIFDNLAGKFCSNHEARRQTDICDKEISQRQVSYDSK